jgi:hypothetical protein
MEILRSAYERDKKLKNENAYTFVRKQKIGNVERNVFEKKMPRPDKWVTSRLDRVIYDKWVDKTVPVNSTEYVKHNGRFMQLKNYKELLKSKNKSPSSQKLSSHGKSCKKDCSLSKKESNKKTI